MIRTLFSILLISLLNFSKLAAQLVDVSGNCVSGTVLLSNAGTINGKPAYTAAGTVSGTANTVVSIYWLGAPDNVWVLEFDGQPYYSNNCSYPGVPGTRAAGCTWTAVSGQPCTGVNPLVILGSGTLPVLLLDFRASLIDKRVELQWETSFESNNKGFYIQRSTDGMNWISIGFVSGTGNSNDQQQYHFTDRLPEKGDNFYRLAQTDIDDKTTFSKTVHISTQTDSPYQLGINPSLGKYQLFLPYQAGNLEMILLDQAGRQLSRKKLSAGATETLDLSPYSGAVFFLRLQINNRIYTEKIIRQ